MKDKDNVNHPDHYTAHPSGVECIQITEHMNFCLGNAVKYIWRADMKGGLEDLKKAVWYIQREIEMREAKKRPELKIRSGILVSELQAQAMDAITSSELQPESESQRIERAFKRPKCPPPTIPIIEPTKTNPWD